MPVPDTALRERVAVPLRRVRASWLGTALRWTMTAASFALVWFALTAPTRLDRLDGWSFVRIPVEALVVLSLYLALPRRWGRVLAFSVGLVLGLLTVAKVLDMGFYAEIDRPFNPVYDWGSFGPAVGVLRDSVGSFWTDAAVVGAIVLGAAVVILTPLAALHLSSLAARRRSTSLRVIAALGVVWVAGAAFGAPVASSGTARLAIDEVRDVHDAYVDEQRFAAALTANDPMAHVPTHDLLTGLRGKDVLFVFVESYGQVAVQNSRFSAQDDATLRSTTSALASSGFDSRSAFLTSPTFGGISWLAHSTLQSGLWVDNQQRYDELVSSQRYTLSDAFKQAGWRTVGDVPSNQGDWPQGHSFYHYDALYDRDDVGYHGPSFSYASMPDQYTLATFQRLELDPDESPVMAEIDLVSSHTPWTPLPHMIPWSQVGDGSVYDPMPAQGLTPSVVWRSAAHVQDLYGQSIRYSISAVVSWIRQLHDDNLVVVMLGDHQPATIVSGDNANHDVPISIISHDPTVLARIDSWGWPEGLLPPPDAPVASMDTFRDRFLTAFDTQPGH